MKRTTTPNGWPAKPIPKTPTKEGVLKAIGRTAKWLRDARTTNTNTGPMVVFEEPLWKGWVLGFHHEGEMFLCVPFRKHNDMVYKLTPAGWTMKAPPAITKSTLNKRRKLAAEKGYSL